jgi:ClpP class serine protease
MSGGTLIVLAAAEIVMTPYSVLGPIDPQLRDLPAASLIKVVEQQKPLAEIDDETLVRADVGRKAIAQVKKAAQELLHRRLPAEQADALAEKLSTGTWTHDYPISADEAGQLGLPVNTEMPLEVLELMRFTSNPCPRSPAASNTCRCRGRGSSPARRERPGHWDMDRDAEGKG